MGHIHDGIGEHDLTVSAFIVRRFDDEYKLLLHLHKKLNKYIQIGGHVEKSENPIQALGHELLEESGYLLNDLMFYQPKLRISKISGAILHPVPVSVNTHPFNESHNHIDLEYALFADHEPNNRPAVGESQQLLWVSLVDLENMDNQSTVSNVREIGIFVLRDIVNSWEVVPAVNYKA